jgi:hypothetical protein
MVPCMMFSRLVPFSFINNQRRAPTPWASDLESGSCCYCTVLFLLSHVWSMRSYCNDEKISSEILMDYVLSAPLKKKKEWGVGGLFESRLYAHM